MVKMRTMHMPIKWDINTDERGSESISMNSELCEDAYSTVTFKQHIFKPCDGIFLSTDTCANTHMCTYICDSINHTWGGYSSTVEERKFKKGHGVMSLSNMCYVLFISKMIRNKLRGLLTCCFRQCGHWYLLYDFSVIKIFKN